jgi:hypothetical protein
MLRFGFMRGTHIYIPVCMYSHVLQHHKSNANIKLMINVIVVSRPEFHAISNIDFFI